MSMGQSDIEILYAIAQEAIDGCNWPSLRERLLEVASKERLDSVWMHAAQEAGRTVEPLMDE